MDRVVDCIKADLIGKIGNLETALKILDEIKDFEAKSMAYLHLFEQTKNEKFLEKAVDLAENCNQRDAMLLLIVESVAKVDRERAEKIAELIGKEYYKNKAFSAIIEHCNALELLSKVSCKRTLSAALKRLALRERSIEIALKIPDPYYRAIALMDLRDEREDIIVEVKKSIKKIKNEYLKKKLVKKLKQF